MRVRIAKFGAWAAGLVEPNAWREWAKAPHALVDAAAPDVGFLASMHRRRCDTLARMMLAACHACGDDARLAGVPTVFASRHGPFDTTVGLLRDLAEHRPLSPTRFSHSVHNTQLGLFSIWTHNQRAASAVSARGDTFAAGFVETLALMRRTGAPEALFVTGDVPVPPELASLSDERHGGHALALLLARDGSGPELELRLDGVDAPPSKLEWPDAMEFLRWLLSGGTSLVLQRDQRRWTWSRSEP